MGIGMRKRTAKGFTLVELMIVVAIIGILAVLAIYGVSKYLVNAKTGEARNALGQISKGASAAYEDERNDGKILAPGASGGAANHQLCLSAAAVPAAVPNDRKYQSSAASGVDWQLPVGAAARTTGWPCLKFSLTEPQYFQYAYTATTGADGTFVATANGDFKGDDTAAATIGFNITGKIIAGQLTVAQQIKEFEGAAGTTVE